MSFLTPFVTFKNKPFALTFERHYDVEVEKAWEICQDYTKYLKVLVVPPSKFVEEPVWIEKSQTQPGLGTVKYKLSVPTQFGNAVNELIETVTKLEKTDDGFIMEYTQNSSKPPLPFRNHHCVWQLIRFKENRTHLKWTRYFDETYALGAINVTQILADTFRSTAPSILDAFRDYFAVTYPRRLPGKADRVLIVGAGPSGLHMAHVLASKGYTNITIMEKSERYGGKTVTIQEGHSENFDTQLVGVDQATNPYLNPQKDIVYHELGTCYLHPAYFIVRALFEELKKNPECQEDFQEIPPDCYEIYRADGAELNFDDWITSNVEVQPTFSFWNLPRILFPYQDLEAEILVAKSKYNALHEDIFGQYNYSLPSPPSTESLELLNMSFGQFLEKYKLNALLPVLAYGNTCQGYGSISDTPAFWAMCWITPELLNGYFTINPRPPFARKSMLKHGWISLWNTIVKLDKLKIRYNTDIHSITRTNDIVRVRGYQNRSVHEQPEGTPPVGEFEEEFDFLVMAAPINSTNSKGDRILDLSEEETRLFNENVEHSQFRTVLYKPKLPQPYLTSHLGIYADRVIGSTVGEGKVYAWRDSYLALHPSRCYDKDESLPYNIAQLHDPIRHNNDPKRDEVREQMAYQYVEDNKNFTEEDLQNLFKKWAHDRFGNGNYQVLREQSWDYFTRFNFKGVNLREPWEVVSIQGKNKTLFVHASTFFESVLDIVNYNNMLYDGLTGEFNKLTDQAPSDKKPRPEDSLLFKSEGIISRIFFTLLTWILNIIWTLVFYIGYPILQLIIFPIQRYSIQVAFKTKNISFWKFWSLNLFIRVSPSVICVVEKNEDPVITKIYSQPDLHFPGIQRPLYALNWNYQDYRIMIAEWLRVNQPTYLAFITPKVSFAIRRFRRWSPMLYSFFFSLLAMLNFSYLTGYSYRKEDNQGGGCYVPKCQMLAISKKEYGEEVGSRICTHVCKIFTEEFMRSKGLDCTFNPDFTNGSCMIRGLPGRTTPCSDNALYEW